MQKCLPNLKSQRSPLLHTTKILSNYFQKIVELKQLVNFINPVGKVLLFGNMSKYILKGKRTHILKLMIWLEYSLVNWRFCSEEGHFFIFIFYFQQALPSSMVTASFHAYLLSHKVQLPEDRTIFISVLFIFYLICKYVLKTK